MEEDHVTTVNSVNSVFFFHLFFLTETLIKVIKWSLIQNLVDKIRVFHGVK